MSDEARLRLAFCGLHPDRADRLKRAFGSPAGAVGALASGRVAAPEAVRAAAALPFAACRERLARLGVTPLFRGGAGYPAHLADLPGAPDVLFSKGALPAQPGVAIVGTRRCTRYGTGLARVYGQACAAVGWPVISGLARGADAEAHRGVVDAGGAGVAVLGCGPDIVYPAEHRPLLESLLAGGGGMVTEYPPGARPEPWRFPPRNRIIAGLAGAVVVVEAGETGGALITAAAALEQGRHVFAVPGDVGRATSRGCNLLIRDGATPVLDPADLVASLSLLLGPGRAPAPSGPAPPVEGPGRALLAALPPGGAALEEAATAAGLGVAEAMAALARLEVAGLVRRDGGLVLPGR
ncbi:MAG: DNA-protecting protein DprA [Actinobacteria bacterium]|nr:DNA-protecting protein DprA [Actinomycetota bacterium]